MELSEDWKSFFPISVSCDSPNLPASSERTIMGPLIFNPIPQTFTHLFSSPSLLPPPLYFPQLSLSRFLVTSSPGSSVLHSTASSISGPHYQNDIASALRYNRLEFLKCGNSVLLFFPTGENSEQVGFLTLCVEGSDFKVKADGDEHVFRATSGASHCITRISANPVDHSGESSSTVGYLLASTCYSVHWFSVHPRSLYQRPNVVYKGSKTFKTSSVAHACWSPHIPEESLVLLESGELFLFDLEYYMNNRSSNGNFKGTKLSVPWHDSGCSNDKDWLCCEFSWHPRILIVASSDAVFLVDLSGDSCAVSCLLKVGLLDMHMPDLNERFVALSRAGPDGFYFTVASSRFLLLCDVRKHMMPIIRWAHRLERPWFMNVLSLSTLRSHSREDTYELASDVGFCIMLGSFCNGEFNLFYYGCPKLSETNMTCALELPSQILLSGRDCRCGSCVLTEESSKVALPEWVDWQMKKEMVVGFCIMNNDLASSFCEPDRYGGFTLVRLMSSGKLELQRYRASWAPDRKFEDCHEQGSRMDKYLLFSVGDEKYEFPKRSVFLDLKFFYAYQRGNLAELLVGKQNCTGKKERKQNCTEKRKRKQKHPCTDVQQVLFEKLNACGVGPCTSSSAIIASFEDVKPSASLYEVALRGLWAELPLDLLRLAFTKYSESSDDAAMEFLGVSPLPELPPFFLRKPSPVSNKGRSRKVQCSDDIVGPVLPLPILLVLREIYGGRSDLENGKFSVAAEIGLKCNEVKNVAADVSVSASGPELFDDAEDCFEPKPFLLYRPIKPKCFATDHVNGNSLYRDKNHEAIMFHVQEDKPVSVTNEITESVGQEIFGDVCPFKLRFNAPPMKFQPNALKAYNVLKRQMSKWQQGVDSYQQLYTQSKSGKAVHKRRGRKA